MPCHHQDDAPLEIPALLKKYHLKVTRQREGILTALLAHHAPMTAEELYLSLKAAGENYGLSTVYRTLGSLEQCGVIEKAFLPGDTSQYYRFSQRGHRHHLICVGCRKTVSIDECPVEQFSVAVGEKNGFTVTGHSFEIFGLCPDCQALKKEKHDPQEK